MARSIPAFLRFRRRLWALETVARGDVVFSAGVASGVLSFFTASQRPAPPFPQLTERERQILDLVARGLTNAAIARRLFLSNQTVRNHVSNALTKLHATDRAEAVARARDAGLGTTSHVSGVLCPAVVVAQALVVVLSGTSASAGGTRARGP